MNSKGHLYLSLTKSVIRIAGAAIGIKPKYIWVEERQRALLEAINRYVQADMKIPVEWVEEYNSLVNSK